MRATAIIPVKRFGAAKQRLLDALDRPGRAALVKAMLADVLAATASAELIERMIVVTGERRAERIALAPAPSAPPYAAGGLPRSQGRRPPGGGDAGDRPRQGARSRLRRPAARGLSAARPGGARRGARAHAGRPGGDRAGPPRHRYQRAAALAAGRDRPRLRSRKLRPPRRPRAPRRARGCRSSRSTRWASTSTRRTTLPRSPRRWSESPTGRPRRRPSWREAAGSGAGREHEPPASRSCPCTACRRSTPATRSAS